MFSWSAPLYIGCSLVIWYIAVMVYKANKESEGNFYLSLVGFCGGLWAFTQGIRWIIPGKWSLLPYYLNYVSIIFIVYSVLILILSFPVKFRLMKYKYVPYILMIPQLIMIFFLITNPIHNYFFQYFHPIENYPDTWVGEWGIFGRYFYVPVSLGYIFVSLIIIVYRILFTKNLTSVDRKILLLFIELILVIGIPTLFFYILPVIKLPEPNPIFVLIIVGVSIRAYMALTKYNFLSLEYVKEAEIEKIIQYEIGKNYIVYKRNTAYRMFREFAAKKPGLVVSVKFPLWIRTNYNIMKSPVVWVTETEYGSSINPERIEFELTYTMIDFYRQNPDGILLLDGISYLSIYNGFEKTYKLIKDVCDMASSTGGTFILAHHDGKVFKDRERNMIEILFDESVDIEVHHEMEEGWVIVVYSELRDRIKYASKYSPKFFTVTTKNPRDVKNSLWISNISGIPPEKLHFEGMEIITNMIGEGYDIVLDGPEILTNYLGEEEVIKFIKYLADVCSKNDRKLIITASATALQEKIKLWLDCFADFVIEEE